MKFEIFADGTRIEDKLWKKFLHIGCLSQLKTSKMMQSYLNKNFLPGLQKIPNFLEKPFIGKLDVINNKIENYFANTLDNRTKRIYRTPE